MYYDDNTELLYHRKDTALVQGHSAKFGRDICAKPDGTPRRWMIIDGVRWTLDSAHVNNNKFRPEGN